MRDVIKYGLVLAVLAGGVYGANHFRIVGEPVALTPRHHEFDPYSMPSESTTVEAADAPSQPPLAVLVDTDRQWDDEPAGDRPPPVQTVPGIARKEEPPPDNPDAPEAILPELASEPGDRFSVSEDPETQVGDSETESIPAQLAPDKKGAGEEATPQDDPGTRKREAEPPDEDQAAEEAADPAPDPSADSDEPADAPANGKELGVVSKSGGTAPMRFVPRDLPVRHVIGEGDTLPKLAERYLGDRHRYPEIFEANREVLHDPRLLPIGVELTIASAAESDVAKPEQASQEAEAPAAPQPETSSDDVSPKLQPIPPESLPRPGQAVSAEH